MEMCLLLLASCGPRCSISTNLVSQPRWLGASIGGGGWEGKALQSYPLSKGEQRLSGSTVCLCQRHSISSAVRRMRPLSAAGVTHRSNDNALLFLKCPNFRGHFSSSPPWPLVHEYLEYLIALWFASASLCLHAKQISLSMHRGRVLKSM